MNDLISIPKSLYDELMEYFGNIMDTDLDSDRMIPNKEMQLYNQLDECTKKTIKPCSTKNSTN